MRSKTIAVIGAALVLLLAPDLGRAEGPVEVYPEQRADGQVYTVGRWQGGTYATALREYPEVRPDGAQVYVYVWDDGTQSVLLREYAEAAADGVWTVRAWEDGTYTRAQASPPPPPQGPLQAQEGPLKPIPKPAPLDAAVRNAAWFATVSVVVPARSGGYSQGTGIVVQTSTEGFDLLTAHHVVAGRREDEPMRVGPFGGWIQTAVVVATAPRQDLALLRVASDVRVYGAALLGDSDAVGVGDAVYVLSYPASGLGNPVLTEGVLLGRYPGPRGRGTVLGTNAHASPGSSGGIAIDAQGQVIGVVSARVTDRDILRSLGYPEIGQMTLLVPSNEAAALVERAASGG